MLDSKHMIVVNEECQEKEVDILLTFDSPDGTKKFVLITDPDDPEENVYAFLYDEEGGMEEVSDPQDFKMCQEVLSAFMDEEEADEA